MKSITNAVTIVGKASEFKENNFVLLLGQFGYETDTKKIKIGDGITTYKRLEYLKGDSSDKVPLKRTIEINGIKKNLTENVKFDITSTENSEKTNGYFPKGW